MAGDLVDLAEAALDIADVVGEVVDAGSRRRRRKGCLILLATLVAVAGLFWLMAG